MSSPDHHFKNDAEQQLAEFLLKREGAVEYLQHIDAIRSTFEDMLASEEYAEEGRITIFGVKPRSIFTSYAYAEAEDRDNSPVIYGRNFTESRLLVFRTLFPRTSREASHYTAILTSMTHSTSGELQAFGSNILHIFADDTSRVFSAASYNPGGIAESIEQVMKGELGPYIHYEHEDIALTNNNPDYILSPDLFYGEHWRISDLDRVGDESVVISGNVKEDLYPFVWFLDNYVGSELLERLYGSYPEDE